MKKKLKLLPYSKQVEMRRGEFKITGTTPVIIGMGAEKELAAAVRLTIGSNVTRSARRITRPC